METSIQVRSKIYLKLEVFRASFTREPMRGVISLCGSTRFKKEYEYVNRILELNYWVVLNVASYYHCERNASLIR